MVEANENSKFASFVIGIICPEADFNWALMGLPVSRCFCLLSTAGFTMVTIDPVSMSTKASVPSILIRHVQVRVSVSGLVSLTWKVCTLIEKVTRGYVVLGCCQKKLDQNYPPPR